nr:MAG TPA: protein of unknown function DUF2280 [Caudoviricetes sp.]
MNVNQSSILDIPIGNRVYRLPYLFVCRRG